MTKILIVEDDAILLKVYKKKLELEGYTVTIAFDGEEGLSQALQVHPDLILLDLMMPKMDGMTVMQKLREDAWGHKVPIIILTNLSPNDFTDKRVYKDQPAYYLVKADNTPEEVVEKVNEVLGKEEARG